MELLPKDKWFSFFAALGVVTMGIMAMVQGSYIPKRNYDIRTRAQYQASPTVTPTLTEEEMINADYEADLEMEVDATF